MIGCNKVLVGNSWAGKRGRSFQAERGRKLRREIKSPDLGGEQPDQSPAEEGTECSVLSAPEVRCGIQNVPKLRNKCVSV